MLAFHTNRSAASIWFEVWGVVDPVKKFRFHPKIIYN